MSTNQTLVTRKRMATLRKRWASLKHRLIAGREATPSSHEERVSRYTKEQDLPQYLAVKGVKGLFQLS